MTQDVGSKSFADRLFATTKSAQPAAAIAVQRIRQAYEQGKKYRAGLALASEIPRRNPLNLIRRSKLNARIQQLTGPQCTLNPSVERGIVDSFPDIMDRQIAQKADDRAQLVAFERFVLKTGDFTAAAHLTISESRRYLLDAIKDFALLRRVDDVASATPQDQDAKSWKSLALQIEQHASDAGRENLRTYLNYRALTAASELQSAGYTNEAHQLLAHVSLGRLFANEEPLSAEPEVPIDTQVTDTQLGGPSFF